MVYVDRSVSKSQSRDSTSILRVVGIKKSEEQNNVLGKMSWLGGENASDTANSQDKFPPPTPFLVFPPPQIAKLATPRASMAVA